MSVEIQLTKGFVAIVDDEDAYLSERKWHAVVTDCGYVYATTRNGGGKRIKMHRAIMKPPSHLVVDHINHNTLDNRRANLRIVTHAENSRNHKDGYRQPYADGYEYLMNYVRSLVVTKSVQQ